MKESVSAAIQLVKAQASMKPMTENEIIDLVSSLSFKIDNIGSEEIPQVASIEPKKSIKESSVQCIECGQTFKVLTKKHLATHGLTPREYRVKWGLKPKQPLAAKSVSRARRNKMQEMRLWEKIGQRKVGQQVGQQNSPKAIKKTPKVVEIKAQEVEQV